ncbi:NAD(P)H-hydrate epimerase [Paenibacillus rubinfantis]|uniref:NAD(P)H-hydrate epimerase n=1 Tax=Paenibacillus rubinfantis TaxID=1720296 RepID=UPI001E3F445C|nr:NAD(P)H-hydrate epimerase [Paenibacillus rubinfantis]
MPDLRWGTKQEHERGGELMKFVTSEQMRAVDRYAIERIGIPAVALMENAGRAIAEEVLVFCRGRRDGRLPERPAETIRERPAGANEGDRKQGESDSSYDSGAGACRPLQESGSPPPVPAEHWLILVGKGNNGGDGLVCARHLADAGVQVSLLYAEEPERLGGEAALQQTIAAALGLPGEVYAPGTVAAARSRGVTGIVDALLGTGAKGAPRGAYASLIREANETRLPIVAADIPSGLDADTGVVHDPCIQARITVCLAFLKAGLTQYPGAKAAGDVVARYIGIPRALPPEIPAAEVGVLLTDRSLRGELGVDVGRRREAGPHGQPGVAARRGYHRGIVIDRAE